MPMMGQENIRGCRCSLEDEISWEDEETLSNPWAEEEVKEVPAAKVEEIRRIEGRKRMEDLARKSKDGKVRSWQVEKDQIHD